ncbi:hypothetical protein VU04_06155 [Desulfobulbus sp. TB]|nr:hypothetical protein [Desulfobulbus sp. TB]
MNFQQILNKIIEKKDEVLHLGLSLIFFMTCVTHIILIVIERHIEQMWMVFGTLAIILLLINGSKNLITIFAVIIFGTFVADEEFLLEVAAITKGEQLFKIRESRNFEVLTVTPEKEINSALTNKLKKLLESEKKPEDIIHALENYRIELEIKEDLPGFDPVDKDVIITFARKGVLDESVFFKIMQDKGYSVNSISNTFEKLGSAEYLANNPDNIDEAKLTSKGVYLAKTLGVTSIHKTYDQTETE